MKASKLDSTFALFDAAETSCVRQFVVSQLCDLVRQSSRERPLAVSPLTKILNAISERLLLSGDSKWELRIAASEALGRVVEAATYRLQQSSTLTNKDIRISLLSLPFNVPSLNDLNVIEFVNSTIPLLAEDTVELPQLAQAAPSAAEAVRSHQLELDKRLGFVLPNQVLDSQVRLTSEDLPDFQISLQSPPNELSGKVNPVRYLEHVSGVSEDPVATAVDSKRVKTEKQEDAPNNIDCEDCEFLASELSRLFLLFSQNVFNPLWQVRHGALLGLRSVMALAMMKNDEKMQTAAVRIIADEKLANWLATVIFCVIVADRFADYASEEVTCPTQETAAQLLVYIAAILTTKRGYETIFSKLKVVLTGLSAQQWSVLFGALSVLKYAAALSSLNSSQYWKLTDLHAGFFRELDALLNSESTEDDVRCLSCQIITNFVTNAANLFDHGDFLRIKNAALTYLVENSDAPSSVRCRYLNLLEVLFLNDTALSLSISSSVDADTCLIKVLSLLSDLISQTRIAVLKLFGTKELLVSLKQNAILFVAHRVFSQLLIDPDPASLADSYSNCWSSLCSRLKFDDGDISVCQPAVELLNKLFCLAMQHTDLGFKPEMFAYSPDDVPQSARRYVYMGGEAVKNMPPPEKNLFLIKLRLQAISVIAYLVDKCFLVPGKNTEFFEARLGEMLRFFAELRAGYPLFSFGMFITKHQNLAELPDGTAGSIADRILAILQDMAFTFEETIPLLSLIRELCRQLLENFRNGNIPLAQLPEALLDMAAALIKVSVERKPAAFVDAVEQLQSRLRVAVDEYSQLSVNMGRRSRLSLTAAWLKLTCSQKSSSNNLPEKLNPIIHPIMSVLLNGETSEGREKCAELVELAAGCLVEVLARCYSTARTPSPEVKIVRNLLTQSSPSTISIISRVAALNLGEKVFAVFPSLLSILEKPNPEDEEKSFMVAEYLAPHVSEKDFTVLKDNVLARGVNKLLNSAILSEVSAASKCLAAMAKRCPDEVMAVVLRSFVASGSSTKNSQAPVLAATSLCELFADSAQLKPYLVPFVRPVLSASVSIPRDANLRQDSQSRELAAKCLSSLVSLLANDSALEPPALCSDNELFQVWSQSYDLLRWLRNPSSLPPVDIKSCKGLNKDVTLRHYQSEGVTWLSFLQQNGLHGVLADDLGLGKTLQALCLLALDHQQAKTTRASLILCPSTLLHHWEYEITKFFSNIYLRPVVYAGSPSERRRIADRSSSETSHLIVISSYDIFRHDAGAFFLSRPWRFCILDEGHVIRNAKSKLFQSLCRLDCSHRLVLTGTPVHNTVGDLWALFEFLMPGYLGSSKEFAAKYTKPITAAGSPKATERDISLCKDRLESLHRATLPFILRRLKSDVLTELPAKVIQDVFCDMTGFQLEIYHALMGGAMQKRRSGEVRVQGQEAEIKHVFQLIRALRLVCNHPCLVRKNDPQLHSANYSGKFAVLRRLLVDLNILGQDEDSEKGSTADNNSASDNDQPSSPQFPQAVGGHRVLLFCQESACVRLVEELFLSPLSGSLSWLRMDSQQTPAERFQTAVRFNSDPSIDILLLTTRVGGQGLNLTGADTVIFFDSDWNPQADLQAMDRAHRIGQQRTVHVFRLVTRGSIEERVMSLQRFKLNVADSVVNADNANVLESLSASDLYDLVFGSATGSVPQAGSGGEDDYYESTSSGHAPKESTPSRSFKDVMADLGDLWSEAEYSAEFDFSNFLSRFSQQKSENKHQ